MTAKEQVMDALMEGSEAFESTRKRFLPERDYKDFVNKVDDIYQHSAQERYNEACKKLLEIEKLDDEGIEDIDYDLWTAVMIIVKEGLQIAAGITKPDKWAKPDKGYLDTHIHPPTI